MSSLRTAYTARWVLPISAPALSWGAVVVEGTRIVDVGSAAQVRADRIVDFGNAVILPGLVNTHSHLELTGLRGSLEGLPFEQWLRTLTAARAELFDNASLQDAAVQGIHEGLRHGITTFGDATASGVTLAALRETGVRGIAYLEVFGPDPAQRDESLDGLKRGLEIMRAHESDRCRAGVSPHAPYTVSSWLFEATARLALEEQTPLSVHIAESAAETLFVRDGTGPFAERLRRRGIAVQAHNVSPISLLRDTGVLATRPLLVHCIHVDAADVATIAASGATIAHCPVSNAKLGHGIAPLAAWVGAGISVGLGSDSVASNDRMDVLGEARQAVLLHSLQSGVPDSLGAYEALELATLGGARALGMSEVTGSLETGKAADLTVFSLDNQDAQPVHDPAVTLVHVLAGAQRAQCVLVDGVERVRDGQVLDVDPAWQERVTSQAARVVEWRHR